MDLNTLNTIEKVKKLIKESNNIVFFGGAGVSTASGVPDFRSATGLYNQKNDTGFSPEYMLSHEFFEKHPDLFYDYLKENLMIDGVKPNNAHIALKKLEDEGKLKGIITQNIDGLHTLAGSKNVVEIHGNIKDYYCTKCKRKYNTDYIKQFKHQPFCEDDKEIVRPDVVLYGEKLKDENVEKAIDLISNCDILIVGGTSLVVYPAAGMIRFYNSNKLILINKEKTSMDKKANYVINDDIAKVLPEIAGY
ncbi:MAG: NAD-dependent protein deacylase [Peptoniphilaceae bacterium]|nr:NAD-dependent protein deacylase [Peptoniphilaceae bacterium]MDY3738078.1 NAD-dependent protein deacylase [Peptoniphilaceae bacterium]